MLVKICGLKDETMLNAALEAGADYVGLVYFEKSPRHVTLEQAKKLANTARGRAASVLLMVNPLDDVVQDAAQRVKPDYIQLHGNETPERVWEIRKLTGCPVIKAIGVREAADTLAADAYGDSCLILFDAKADPALTELPGGNGIPFDWRALKGQKEKRDFMLSGGLTAETVAAAIRLTKAPMVDVSSGVESAPGVKDADLIRAFINAAKEV